MIIQLNRQVQKTYLLGIDNALFKTLQFMAPIQILKPEIDKLFALMDFHKEVRISKISMN